MSNSNSNNSSRKSVKIIIEESGYDEVELTVIAHSDDFRARGSAFFSLSYLRNIQIAFADMPISEDRIPAIVGGYWSDDGKELIEEHVHISVHPIDKHGNLLMTVMLFSPDLDHYRKGIGCFGRCDYRLQYEDLKNFSDVLQKLFSGYVNEIEFNGFSS